MEFQTFFEVGEASDIDLKRRGTLRRKINGILYNNQSGKFINIIKRF